MTRLSSLIKTHKVAEWIKNLTYILPIRDPLQI